MGLLHADSESVPVVLVWFAVVRRAVARRQVRGGVKVKKQKKTESLATVTPLVRSIFDSMFQGQIDEKGTAQKKRRCGICEVQMSTDYLLDLAVLYFMAELSWKKPGSRISLFIFALNP